MLCRAKSLPLCIDWSYRWVIIFARQVRVPWPIASRNRSGSAKVMSLTSAPRFRRGSHVMKLERIPLEMLVLLVEHKGEIVTRDEIVAQGLGQGCLPRYRQQHPGRDPQTSSGAEG